MGKIKGVIFDLDGTLIDSLETYTQALNQGIERFNLAPVGKDQLASLLNKAVPLEQMLEQLFPAQLKDRQDRLDCIKEITKAYQKLEQNVPPKPGAAQVLSSLKEMGLKVGIVTGRTTSGETKWLELRRLNIDQFIDVMITGAEAERKPAPEGIIKCAQELGLSPDDCVFVGDSQADIITGKAAGVMTIAIPTGVAEKAMLSQEGPDAIVDSLAELLCQIIGDFS
jgi:HAD superfamily hydrolase (TIGR01509 family)